MADQKHPDITDEQRENYKLWIAALRSGKYKQGQELLSYGDRLCCLGVACKVFGEPISDRASYPSKNGAVEQALGATVPAIGAGDVVYLNDSVGASFEQIADALEKEYVNND